MTRVLQSGDPRGDDYRAAGERVAAVRSQLGELRSELRHIGRIEAMFPFDRLCDDVAGALTLAIIALHELVSGDRSFQARAERTDALWADVRANPSAYTIKDGRSWDWRTPSWALPAGLPVEEGDDRDG